MEVTASMIAATISGIQQGVPLLAVLMGVAAKRFILRSLFSARARIVPSSHGEYSVLMPSSVLKSEGGRVSERVVMPIVLSMVDIMSIMSIVSSLI